MRLNPGEKVCQSLAAQSLSEEGEGRQNRWRGMLCPHQTATSVIHLLHQQAWIIRDAHLPRHDCRRMRMLLKAPAFHLSIVASIET